MTSDKLKILNYSDFRTHLTVRIFKITELILMKPEPSRV